MALASPPMLVSEHELEVPLDHADPDGAKITVFAREVADPDGADRPFLVYFEGGPGYEAPRPTRVPAAPGWLGRALKEFRVLLLDQRGTGRSAPVAVAEADRLRHFRADSIVRDAEAFREALGVERWSVLGQSFGGFCVTTYLSLAPEGAARGVHHRRPAARRPSHRRRLHGHVRARARAHPPVLRALPARPAPAARRPRAPERRPPHRPAARPARPRARHERRRRAPPPPARAAARLARVPARRRGRARRSPATRSSLSSTRPATPTAGARAGRPSGCGPPTSCSPASTSTRGCSRSTARWRLCARPPACSRTPSGRASTTRRSCAPTMSRWRRSSTPTTCTWSGPSRRRPPR